MWRVVLSFYIFQTFQIFVKQKYSDLNLCMENVQRRIQDLSEGYGRFIWEQKNPDLGRKRRASGEIFLKMDIFPVLD